MIASNLKKKISMLESSIVNRHAQQTPCETGKTHSQFVSSCLHLESLNVEEMLDGSWHGLEALASSSVCLSQHNSYRPRTLQRQQGHAFNLSSDTKEDKFSMSKLGFGIKGEDIELALAGNQGWRSISMNT